MYTGSSAQLTAPRELALTSRSIAKLLAQCSAGLFVAHIVASYLLQYQLQLNNRHVNFFAGWLDPQGEHNLSALFSSLLLLMAGVLLFFVYKTAYSRRHRVKRLLLSSIFFFLALDEAFTIHEKVSVIAFSMIPNDFGGIFLWAWVIPYGIATVLLFLYFARFLMSLPTRTSRLFFTAGLTYVGSALILEMIEAYILKNSGKTLYFRMISDVEEALEITGVIIFIYALLDYIAPKNKTIKVTNTAAVA